MAKSKEEKEYEKIGKTICRLSYWRYAFIRCLILSLIALVVLYIIGKPLWLAPIIGIAGFYIYRTIRRFVWRTFFRAIQK